MRREPDIEDMRRDMFAVSVSDDETRRTINEVYERYKVLLEPHGAVGWAGLMRYLETVERWEPSVSLETADPAKFPEEIIRLLGIEPPCPKRWLIWIPSRSISSASTAHTNPSKRT